MKNSKNFVRQISESYIKMKLDEAGGDYLPPRPDPYPMTPRRRAFQELDDVLRDERNWRKFSEDPRNQERPQSPRIPREQLRPGNGNTQTTRPPLRLPTLPIPKSPLGRAGAVGLVGALAYGAGTAIDQYIINPQGPKPTPRPYQQDVLPSPESLYPAPSVSQNHTGGYGGSGSGGSGGGLGGGMGGSGR